ncbi:SusC/RagA family TonB-linked outer membrane protein [Aliifodinibius sp. S!AR15-10]|uniref:SusC/RagA family TonB-linked outer membrane protein n=1 Tax=Aliifodinibius sp. S!AR15-10 TaxID=2950437 RepID=UPI00285AE38E|nr:SusC/RagA family TonB-linked outer membrane protein [Aliifodinibius sp. S!AR15-10]MDR8391978.1 SusC/RagA family TonB-linked outer membrane protein [Aliifodinibius sp. S!AR15-10]
MKRYLLLLGFLSICMVSHAQDYQLRGKVIDTGGEALPGVNIIKKGTADGTSTTIDGQYQISVSESDTLVFSFIGYDTRIIPVQGRRTLNVTMSLSTNEMGDVVVTALGLTQIKEKIGYSTQEIETASITNTNAQNLGNLFTGKVAGLSVDNPTGMFQEAQFSLRGKEPLIVVDDIPVESNLFDISKNDIKEINVLKGTAASALYGARGKDGAILITTKDAQSEGLVIDISTSTMVSAGYTVFPEAQKEYGNGSNGQYEFWDGKDGGIADGDMIWGPKFEEGKKIAQWNSPILDTQTAETIEWYGTVEGTKYDDKSRYERVPIAWESHDNLKEFMRPGIIPSTEFSVAYGSDKAKYRFSGNYSYQQGQVPNTSLSRGGVSFASTFELSPTVTLDNKLTYNKVYSPNYPAYGYGPNNHIYTLLVWQGTDVDPDALRNNFWVPGQEGYNQANWNYAWYNNPYFGAYERNQEYNSDVYRGQFSLKWDLMENLYLQARTSLNKNDKFEDQERPKSYLRYGDPRDGFYKTWNTAGLSLDNDLRVNFQVEPASFLAVNVNAGVNSFYQKYEEYYNSTDGLVVPGVYSLNNTNRNVQASTLLRKKAIRSLYATLDLEFVDAFYLNLSGRNDWSSALPESNNSYFYPSASLSVMLSNLVDLPSGLDYLKLYSSWARVSSDLDPDSNNPYQTVAYYQKSGDYNGNPQLKYPSGIVNPNIEPQQSISTELGLSAGILNNRVDFDVTYFNVVDRNQIINLPVSEASGFNSRKVNGNEYTTNGWEVVVNAYPVETSNFNWGLTTNWYTWVRKLTSIYGDRETYNNLSVGERADNYYATGWMKSPDGQVILDEKTGLPTRDPFPQLKGHTNPDWRYGLQNKFQYKDFTLDIGIDGAVGGVMRSLTVEKMWWGGKHPESTTWRDEEYAAGEPVYVPEGVNVVRGELKTDVDGNVIEDTRVFKPNETAVGWQQWSQNYPYRAAVTQDESEKFANIFDRSYLKLRNVSLTYDISDLFKNAGLKKVSLTAFGYNLAILKKAIIIDPDFGNDNNLQDPSTRYVGLKIDAKL